MVSLRVKAIKSYCLMLLIVLFLSLGFFISSPPKILANPIYAPPPPDLGSGHILLPSDYNLSLVEAEVKMEIETREEGGYYMPIRFDGNYTIYNPDSTVTVNISAPFSPYIAALAVDMHIKINDQVVDDEWDGYFYDPYSTPWDEYLTGYRYIITVRNVTIIGASNTTIRFSYETSIFRNKMRIEKEWVFYYDVGSARAWKGNVTERVELMVKGFQAIDYYVSPFSTTEFTLIQQNNQTSYVWLWNNKYIEDDWVYAKLLFPKDKPFTILVPWSMEVSLISIMSFGIIVYILVFKREM